MIVKILFLILIILIALFLIIFSESLYISVALKNDDLSYIGVINIKYYIFQLSFDITTGQTSLWIISKYFTKNIITHHKEKTDDDNENSFNLDKSTDETQKSTDTSEYSSNEENHSQSYNINEIKKLIQLISKSKKDILDLIILTKDIISFKNSYILMNLGLGDNNLTIKTCNKIWAITAPFYSVGLQTILTPELNQTIFKIESNLVFEITLLNILKIFIKLLFNENLHQIIFFFIKPSD